MESGVVFYDPEGQEVVVPSSKVGAFKAALETVIEFEPEPCKGALSKLAPNPDASAAAESTAGGAGVSSASEGCAQGVHGGAGAPHGTTMPSEDAESLRRELKANLQKRYFALLRSGLEPNEAAARAILEAAGHAPEEQSKSDHGVVPEIASGESAQSNCGYKLRARSVSGEASSDSRRSSTEITVSA